MNFKFFLFLNFFLLAGLFAFNPARAESNDCTLSSNFTVILKNVDGTGAEQLKVEVYKEEYDSGDTNKPIVGERVLSGTTDVNGKWVTTFKPINNLRYIIKVYDRSATNGDFWYFKQYTSCGSDFEFKKTLPRLTFVLRDAKYNLIKDADLSLYSFQSDVDGNPVIDDKYLVGTSRPSSAGTVSYYVAGNVPEIKNKSGLYLLQVRRNSQTFIFSNIRSAGTDARYEYVLSGLNLTLKTASGKLLNNATVNIYKQQKGPSLGERLYNTRTGETGQVSFEYPAGIYALSISDDYNRENIFYNVAISEGGITDKIITTNATKFYISSTTADPKGDPRRSFQLYSLMGGDSDRYFKNKSITSLQITEGTDTTISLAPGPYLLLSKIGSEEYGAVFMATNAENRVAVKINVASVVNSDSGVTLKTTTTNPPVPPSPKTPAPVVQKNIISKYKGYFVSVNNDGGLWYIGQDSKRYRLDGKNSVYETVKFLSSGISDSDLAKISLGLSKIYGSDNDKDGLSNDLELALGTNSNKADSDSDKFSDLTELKSNYNPLGKGSLKIDKNFMTKQKGRLFLQAKDSGYLWYISPRDGKRYFLFNQENIKSAVSNLTIKLGWPEIAGLSAGN